ncbi:hypothetical protein AAG570_007099 [Ranatra chinensis]|uniref:gamma-glutamylcyclotransferase n=1 Tax=Ranatra chinensis TaxID=642074 RepID=A0ABD0Y819_9HEMI
MAKKKLLYFAYCVNMLSTRMDCCVHSSVKRKGIGKLVNYKLVFGEYSKVWQGCLATIVPHQDSVVWGSLWEMDDCHRPKLDSLQGVSSNIYQLLKVDISSLKGKAGTFESFTYKLVKDPETPKMKHGKLMKRFRPSKIYMDELIEGACEACLPVEYRKWLRSIPHNGYTGSVLPR